LKDNMGIKGGSHWYYVLNSDQKLEEEYIKIQEFINSYVKNYSINNNISIEDLSLEFINYGKTELVYVLSEKSGKKQTILVKQPAVEYGKVKQEAEILSQLAKKDKNVIAPVEYFSNEDQELYVTPYLNQARCVASYGEWGVYVPEPIYRFEEFNDNQADVINACMIAKLVSYYDAESGQGLSECKLGGGDFVLAKGWENEDLTESSILNNLYLIAGREKITCSFDQYLDLLRGEFSRKTIDDEKNPPVINIRGRVPMTTEQIERGISLGMELISNKNNHAVGVDGM